MARTVTGPDRFPLPADHARCAEHLLLSDYLEEANRTGVYPFTSGPQLLASGKALLGQAERCIEREGLSDALGKTLRSLRRAVSGSPGKAARDEQAEILGRLAGGRTGLYYSKMVNVAANLLEPSIPTSRRFP